MNDLANRVLMGVLGLILLRGVMTGSDVYGAFVRGAQRGFETAVSLLPALCAMTVMLSLLRASGVMELLVRCAAPLLTWLNLPPQAAPMLLFRPLSGSASLSVLQEIFAQCGADSRAGRAASVLMGSSETIVYTMTVYLAAARVNRLRGVLGVSIISYLVGAAVCGWTVR